MVIRIILPALQYIVLLLLPIAQPNLKKPAE